MVAISATDRKLTASLDLRFEKCSWFLIVDHNKTCFIENLYQSDNDRASKVVDMLLKEKVTKIITGEIGPKSKQLLEKHKIQMIFLSGDKVSLQYIVNLVSNSAE